jgi:hypothetical protein
LGKPQGSEWANLASVAVALLFTKFVKDELGNDITLLCVALIGIFAALLFRSAPCFSKWYWVG